MYLIITIVGYYYHHRHHHHHQQQQTGQERADCWPPVCRRRTIETDDARNGSLGKTAAPYRLQQTMHSLTHCMPNSSSLLLEIQSERDSSGNDQNWDNIKHSDFVDRAIEKQQKQQQTKQQQQQQQQQQQNTTSFFGKGALVRVTWCFTPSETVPLY